MLPKTSKGITDLLLLFLLQLDTADPSKKIYRRTSLAELRRAKRDEDREHPTITPLYDPNRETNPATIRARRERQTTPTKRQRRPTGTTEIAPPETAAAANAGAPRRYTERANKADREGERRKEETRLPSTENPADGKLLSGVDPPTN